MNTQLERDLRDALAERATRLTGDPRAQILSHDYKARAGVPRGIFLGAGAVLAAGALAGILAVTLATSTPRAFAGWSRQPSTTVGNRAVLAQQTCRSALPSSAAIEHAQQTAAGSHTPWLVPKVEPSDWRTVLTDVRGPYTVTVFAAAQDKVVFSCLAGQSPRAASVSGVSNPQTPVSVPAGQVAVVSAGGSRTSPEEGSAWYSRVLGRTGLGVTGVAIRLTNGTKVAASISNGWFLAWWPGSAHVSSAEVSSANGTTTQPNDGAFGPASK